MNYNAGYQEKVLITNDKTITIQGKQVVDAYQLNPSENGTLANQISKKVEMYTENNAATHNRIFRGKNLTGIYTIDQICQRISNGTFEDLYIGDYFDITISTSYTTSEVVRCIIAGFDLYLNKGDTPLTRHHAVIVTKNCFTKTHQMNPTNTTEGGFAGSAMWTTVLSTYANAIAAKLGSHLLTYRQLLTNSVDANAASAAGAGWKGSSNNWAWYDTKLTLMSRKHVTGGNEFSSSGYDTGIDNFWLPLFMLDPTALVCKLGGTDTVNASNRMWYWQKDVASVTYFCLVYGHGYSDYYSASDSGGVRPLWLMG